MTRQRLLLAFGLLLSLSTCAARKSALDPPAIVARAEAQGLTDRARAISTLEGFLADNPDPAVAPWAMVYAGEQRRLAGDMEKARTWFERAAERYPTHPLKNAAVLGMALVDAQTSLSGNTEATLQLQSDTAVPATMNADRYRLLARVAADEGAPPGKVRETARKALAYASADPEVEARVSRSLADLLGQSDAPAPAASAAVALDEVRAALRSHDLDGVVKLAEELQARWPDSDEARVSAALARRAKAGDPTRPNRVGVLLPLSGEYAPPGNSIKEAISLANEREGRPLEIVFVDTAGSPDKAVAALDELVLKQGCMAVVGPLLRPEVEAVSAAANAYEVPLIVLSQYVDIAHTGGWVWSAFLTVEQQVDALAAHAVTTRGLQRFAVLYPKNAYGESARAAFLAAVGARGGQVVTELGYDPEAKDFLDVARLLGQKQDRAAELYRLRRQAEAEGRDPSKVTVPPKVEFQAVFIPDNARRSSLVASALAYEEFPVGTFRPRWDQEPIVLLGLNGWNSPDLAEGGKYMRDSIFVDAFLTTDPQVDGFVDAFQSALDRKPMVVDAMAYDAARIVAQATKKAGADRSALRQLLGEVRIDGPVARGNHFAEDRQLDRELHVLTLSAQGIVPASVVVEPPPVP